MRLDRPWCALEHETEQSGGLVVWAVLLVGPRSGRCTRQLIDRSKSEQPRGRMLRGVGDVGLGGSSRTFSRAGLAVRDDGGRVALEHPINPFARSHLVELLLRRILVEDPVQAELQVLALDRLGLAEALPHLHRAARGAGGRPQSRVDAQRLRPGPLRLGSAAHAGAAPESGKRLAPTLTLCFFFFWLIEEATPTLFGVGQMLEV